MSGVRLNNQFMGTWYNPRTRLLGDWGSNLYVLEKAEPSMGKTEPPTEKAEPPVEKAEPAG